MDFLFQIPLSTTKKEEEKDNMTNTKKAAEARIQQELRAPGHKDALREYNNSRRGDRISGTRVQATKVQKCRSRQALRQSARREIREAGY